MGTIVSDKREGSNRDVLADRYLAGGLWERFEVQWEGEAGRVWRSLCARTRTRGALGIQFEFPSTHEFPPTHALPAGVATPGEEHLLPRQAANSLHSPWEMFEQGTTEAVRAHAWPATK